MALEIVQEMLNNVATQRVRNTAVPAVMANGRPACLGPQRGSRDRLPAFTGGRLIRFQQRFPIPLNNALANASSQVIKRQHRISLP